MNSIKNIEASEVGESSQNPIVCAPHSPTSQVASGGRPHGLHKKVFSFCFSVAYYVALISGRIEHFGARSAYSLSFDPVFTQLEHVEIASLREGPPRLPVAIR